jgi:hypothetical protein
MAWVIFLICGVLTLLCGVVVALKIVQVIGTLVIWLISALLRAVSWMITGRCPTPRLDPPGLPAPRNDNWR